MPVHGFCAEGPGVRILALAKLLELRANPNGGKGGGASLPPLSSLAFASATGNNVLESAQLLLDKKADVNQKCQPEDAYRLLEVSCRAYGFCSKKSGMLVKLLSDVSTTPLGACALLGSTELAEFLLQARADPEIRNNRRLRAVDLAVSEQMRQLLTRRLGDQPTSAISELIAEDFLYLSTDDCFVHKTIQ